MIRFAPWALCPVAEDLLLLRKVLTTRVDSVMFGRRRLVVLVLLGAGLGVRTASGQPDASKPKAAEPIQTNKGPSEATPEQSSQGPAPDSAVREQAKQLYEQGVAAFREGRYSEAVDKLLEADHVMPNAAFSYNIALVYEKMGDERSALRWVRSYLRQSKKSAAEDASAIAKARKFEAVLQSQGLQQVSIVTEPSGATIQVDGHALGITPFTTEIAPGSHRVSLSLQGYEPVQRDFELRPDRSLDVILPMVAQRPQPVSSTNEPTTAPAPVSATPPQVHVQAVQLEPTSPERPALTQVRPTTWVGLGVGALLMGGSAFFEFERRRQEDVAQRASQAQFQSAYDNMEGRKTVARILLVTGSAVLATGATLLVLDLTRSKRENSAWVRGCGDSGICAEMRGQF